MKKILALVALATFTFVSCEKDYTCTCTNTYTEGNQSATTTSTKEIKGATTVQAQAACVEATVVSENGNYETKCELSK